MNESKMDGVGFALEVFSKQFSGIVKFGVKDENGLEFIYIGPGQPNSSTTLFGKWTGIAPYADALPVLVKGRNGMITSALDSFAMMYTIRSYTDGYHNEVLDTEFITRIKHALEKGVISPSRDFDEFNISMRILHSFFKDGHMFNIHSDLGKFEYEASLAANHEQGMRKLNMNVDETFPMFKFNTEEEEMYKRFVEMNGGTSLTKIDSIDTLLNYMEHAGLQNSFEYLWFIRQVRQTKRASEAFKVFASYLDSLKEGVNGEFFSIDLSRKKVLNRINLSITPASRESEMVREITSEIISTLL